MCIRLQACLYVHVNNGAPVYVCVCMYTLVHTKRSKTNHLPESYAVFTYVDRYAYQCERTLGWRTLVLKYNKNNYD